MFIAFRLKPGRDDDLINWIINAGEGDRSYHIREAIRRGLSGQAPGPSFPTVKIEAKQVEDTRQEVNETDLEAALSAWD